MPGTEQDHPLKDFYSEIHRTYDRVNRVFTFGRDRAWRRRAAGACLKGNPQRVLDVCTGTGDFIFEVALQAAKAGQAVSLTGFDFSKEMLEQARRKLAWRMKHPGSPAIAFIEGDVAQMPFEGDSFDAIGITFGIRNLVYENNAAARHLRELLRVLKPGGRLVILESSRPDHLLWRLFNNIYLSFILPYLGAILSGNLKAYRYLGRSSRNYYSIGEMGSVLEGAGFKVLSGRPMFLGSVMMIVATK
jgi:demethylmenaquinone methyltransferase/2-methoxy-6-polyprenyl-1,4-benzoquinol methylase